jgi:peptidoglycan/xylan/chitin deacetylase (PgdA/CDA1 family)
MVREHGRIHLSLAEKTGLVSLAAGLGLGMVSPLYGAAPLLAFLLLSLGAPFLPAFSYYLEVISRCPAGGPGIVLTFDDGPHPDSTPVLLELLAAYGYPATFFLVAEQARQYPDLVRAIMEQGHTIGNHSLRHDNLLMLRSYRRLRADIGKSQEIFQALGVRPLLFRPPVGITNPSLGHVLRQEGMLAINYSCRAMDRGNRRVHGLARRILSRVAPGDIVMLHDQPPHGRNASLSQWQRELESLFSALKTRSPVVDLESCLQRPVMVRL